MLAEEEEHAHGRRAITRALSRNSVDGHLGAIRQIATEEIDSWPVNKPVQLHQHLRALTLRVILRAVFGRDDAEMREIRTRLLVMYSITASLALQEPQLRSLPGWRGAWKSFTRERRCVNDLIVGLIEKEVRHPQGEGLINSLVREALASGKHDMQYVRDTLMSIILAGHETTAAELAWALQLLAHNPDVTNRLVTALDNGDDGYLTATVHEVLRHRAVFLFCIPRVVRKTIEIGKTLYPPGVMLIGCIHLLHHDPRLYPEPHRFLPERFLTQPPRSDLWLPWGGGRKKCPGHYLATCEMQIVLRTVLASYRIAAVSDAVETGRWRSVIVTPGKGSRLILTRRPDAAACRLSS